MESINQQSSPRTEFLQEIFNESVAEIIIKSRTGKSINLIFAISEGQVSPELIAAIKGLQNCKEYVQLIDDNVDYNYVAPSFKMTEEGLKRIE